MKTKEEIYEAVGTIDPDDPKYPGMTYEDGLIEALQWVLGNSGDEPLYE